MLAHAIITDKKPLNTQLVKNKKYYRSNISESRGTVKINEVLPFRIRFTDIRVPGYSSSNVPPIGIAIIGINNYIL
jgi:hypothetical protein